MSLVDIDGALVQGYLAMALGLPTAYEGVKFTPPDTSDWASVFIVPADSDPFSLGVNGTDLHVGFMQIDFNTEPGKGRAGLTAYAQAVRDAFIVGKGYTRNSQNVRITSTSRSQVRRVDSWLRLSMTVNWQAETIRPTI